LLWLGFTDLSLWISLVIALVYMAVVMRFG